MPGDTCDRTFAFLHVQNLIHERKITLAKLSTVHHFLPGMDWILLNNIYLSEIYFVLYYYPIYANILMHRSAVCDEIIRCRGDQVRLAVRARVFPYPEETNAVWIMFAVKYKSIL